MGAAKEMATRTAQGTAELTARRSPHHTWTRAIFERDRRQMYLDLRFAWQLLSDYSNGSAQNVQPEEIQRALNGIEKAGKHFGEK